MKRREGEGEEIRQDTLAHCINPDWKMQKENWICFLFATSFSVVVGESRTSRLRGWFNRRTKGKGKMDNHQLDKVERETERHRKRQEEEEIRGRRRRMRGSKEMSEGDDRWSLDHRQQSTRMIIESWLQFFLKQTNENKTKSWKMDSTEEHQIS